MLPTPRPGEDKTAFMGRAMGMLKNSYPDRHERASIVKAQWNERPVGVSIVNETRSAKISNTCQLTNMSDLVRTEYLDGREYLVAPIVMAKVGVMNGRLYTEEILSKFAGSWSGVPVPVWHPKKDGKWVTANSPEIIAQQCVGRVFNSYYEDRKLKGEVWIDILKCNEIAPDVLQMLNANEMIEVSTGLDAEEIIQNGSFDGKNYNSVVADLRPDHLALLPGGTGACSIEEGAGFPRVNQKEEGEENGMTINLKLGDVLKDKTNLSTILRTANHHVMATVMNELSHDDVWRMLCDTIRESLDIGTDVPCYLVEVYDDYTVYELSTADGYKLWKQGYEVDDDQVKLTGAAEEVVREVNFVPVSNESAGEDTGKVNVNVQSEGDNNMDKITLVDALIANEMTDWAETDKEMLLALNEDVLKRMAPKPPVETPPTVNTEEEETTEEETTEEETTDETVANTTEEYIAKAPEGMREVLSNSLKLHNEQKKALVTQIMANKRNTFSQDVLEKKGLDELQGIAALAVNTEASYVGQAAPVANEDDNGGAPDAMPEL